MKSSNRQAEGIPILLCRWGYNAPIENSESSGANAKGTPMKTNLFMLSLFLVMQVGGSGLVAQIIPGVLKREVNEQGWTVPGSSRSKFMERNQLLRELPR
jgi:hypothetical protein